MKYKTLYDYKLLLLYNCTTCVVAFLPETDETKAINFVKIRDKIG